ncbi:protein SSUH2 homolog [Rhinatrema bivittatum]|uniref:protein SSUH2 homolog n=1 Tax=Rhinatrema bivittatum TaxID=194408 RepID=UPI00112C05E4|nr:protein SSUH2 homolog [Rhinatrema bivittatum]
MQEALNHFDKSLSSVENLPYILSFPYDLPSLPSSCPSPSPVVQLTPLSSQRSSPYSILRLKSLPLPRPSTHSAPQLRSPPSLEAPGSPTLQATTVPSRKLAFRQTQQPTPPSSKSWARRGKKESKKTQTELFLPVRFLPLSEEQIRKVLLDWVSTRRSYRKRAAREMIFAVIDFVIVYLYRLETFIEERSVTLQHKPFGTSVDHGAIEDWQMDPWDVATAPSQMFHNEIKYLRMPHSEEEKICLECGGSKWVECDACLSSGTIRCSTCRGSGRSLLGSFCHICEGKQLVKCMNCMGEAKHICPSCAGQGLHYYFKELKVEFKTSIHQHICSTVEIPHHLVEAADGEILYEHDAERVDPLTTFSEQEINRASQMFVEISENVLNPGCRILRQRHYLKAVPVTRVYYRWTTAVGLFFLYGIKNSVHCTDYPDQSTSCLPVCW